MKRVQCLPLVIGVFLIASTSLAQKVDPRVGQEAALAKANNRLAFDIYRKLATQSKSNIAFSPWSVSSLMITSLEGARGETAREIGEAMHLSEDLWHEDRYKLSAHHSGYASHVERYMRAATCKEQPGDRAERRELEGEWRAAKDRDDREKLRRELTSLRGWLKQYQISTANALFVERRFPIEPEFLRASKKLHGDDVVHICDFQTTPEAERERINTWVSDGTRGRIKNLIPGGSIQPETQLVSVNVMALDAPWQEPFETRFTESASFRLLDTARIKVPMMSQEEMQSGRYAAIKADGSVFDTPDEVSFFSPENERYPENGILILEMPYQGRDLAMLYLLPRSENGLAKLEGLLTESRLKAWISGLEEREVDVRIPRFKAASEVDLTGILESLGVRRAHRAGGKEPAQFGGISSVDGFALGPMYHKAVLEVNEGGTKAAGGSGRVYAGGVMSKFNPKFYATRPFVYVVHDLHSGAILFLGRCVDPR